MAVSLKLVVFRLKRRWRTALDTGQKRVIQIKSIDGRTSHEFRDASKPLVAGDWGHLAGPGGDDLLEVVRSPFRPADEAEIIKRGWGVRVEDEPAPKVQEIAPEPEPVSQKTLLVSLVTDVEDVLSRSAPDEDDSPVFPLAPGSKEPVPAPAEVPAVDAVLANLRSEGSAESSTIGTDNDLDAQPDAVSTAPADLDMPAHLLDSQGPREASLGVSESAVVPASVQAPVSAPKPADPDVPVRRAALADLPRQRTRKGVKG